MDRRKQPVQTPEHDQVLDEIDDVTALVSVEAPEPAPVPDKPAFRRAPIRQHPVFNPDGTLETEISTDDLLLMLKQGHIRSAQ
jgi:hypothetical protein